MAGRSGPRPRRVATLTLAVAVGVTVVAGPARAAVPGTRADGGRATTATVPAPFPVRATVLCPGSGLAVTADRLEGAAGQRYLTLRMVNCSDSITRADRWPQVALLADGQRVPLTPVTEPGQPLPVVLHPGRSVVCVVRWGTVPTGDTEPVEVDGIAVWPLPGAPAQHLALDTTAVPGTTIGIGPWHTGTEA